VRHKQIYANTNCSVIDMLVDITALCITLTRSEIYNYSVGLRLAVLLRVLRTL
jgi:hypothetical protein